MLTEGKTLSVCASFLTTVSRGCRLTRPPGGSELQPVMNWVKAWGGRGGGEGGESGEGGEGGRGEWGGRGGGVECEEVRGDNGVM